VKFYHPFCGVILTIPLTLASNSVFMSLIPNKKNKKDNRPGGGGLGKGKPVVPAQKGKTNTKAVTRNTKLTGGSQRGS
jgi:hypothetical protein